MRDKRGFETRLKFRPVPNHVKDSKSAATTKRMKLTDHSCSDGGAGAAEEDSWAERLQGHDSPKVGSVRCF